LPRLPRYSATVIEPIRKPHAGMASDPGHRQEHPKLSIVTAVFNAVDTLEATIDSLSRQSFRDFEYIVLDGASADGTVELLQRNAARIDFWTSERDTGIFNAWNKALSVARGEWIAFLGADDVYLPDALAQYAQAIAEVPAGSVQYISSRVQLIADGTPQRMIGSAWSWPAFAHHMTVAHVGSMHHRSLFDQYGLFDESYRSGGDYELLLRPRGALRAAFIDRVTARMALGGASNANTSLALREQERAKRTTGGRAAWLCAVERVTARLKDHYRSVIRPR
jgi:glycosyltransferase involved in cell wall biosynthesis